MVKFNFIVRLDNPTRGVVEGLLQTFSNQTNPDWALYLICGQTDSKSQYLTNSLNHPQVFRHFRPDGETPAQSCNWLLPILPSNSWVCLLDQQALLEPNTVELLADTQNARIIYTDSVYRNRFGLFTLPIKKGAVDPIRLHFQNYLDGLVLVQKDWLQQLGGFDPRSSDSPTHHILLRSLDDLNQIKYIPEPLLQTYRDHRKYFATDSRLKPHMPRYDLWAIREHLKTYGFPINVSQQNGTVEAEILHPHRWATSVVINAPTDLHEEIRESLLAGTFKPAQLIFLDQASPAELNQVIKTLDGPLVALLQGVPADCNWLAEMVDWAMFPNTGMVYGRTVYQTRLTFPGTTRMKYEDWNWNTRGSFNNLQTPRQVSTLGNANMIGDIQHYLRHPFRESLSNLYAMDHGLKLHAEGRTNIYLPRPIVMVPSISTAEVAEVTEFDGLYPNWKDEFELYLSM